MTTEGGMKLPDFICVGPARTGTTWLHAALTGHVGLPLRVKETKFWGPHYHKGIQWYADHFRHCDSSRPVGEICPYFRTREARERIARHLPKCKIIVTLRDPVDRSYSQYRLMRRIGLIDGTFEQEFKHPRIVETNRYAFHLRQWINVFGSENIKVLLFRDLKRDPQAFLDQVCEFIGIPNISLAAKTITANDVNSFKYQPRSRRIARRVTRMMDLLHEQRAYRTFNLLDRIGLWNFLLLSPRPFPPLSAATEMLLREQLLPEIEELEDLIGIDLQGWKERSTDPAAGFEEAPSRQTARAFGRREIAALVLALIPFATGAVPDGLDLASMRFNPVQANAVLDAGDDLADDGMTFALT